MARTKSGLPVSDIDDGASVTTFVTADYADMGDAEVWSWLWNSRQICLQLSYLYSYSKSDSVFNLSSWKNFHCSRKLRKECNHFLYCRMLLLQTIEQDCIGSLLMTPEPASLFLKQLWISLTKKCQPTFPCYHQQSQGAQEPHRSFTSCTKGSHCLPRKIDLDHVGSNNHDPSKPRQVQTIILACCCLTLIPLQIVWLVEEWAYSINILWKYPTFGSARIPCKVPV